MKPSDVFITLTVVFIWSLDYSVNTFAVDALPRPMGEVAGVALTIVGVGLIQFGQRSCKGVET